MKGRPAIFCLVKFSKVRMLPNYQALQNAVEPRFNEPLYNEVLGITNDILQPGQSYSKMYGKEPLFNEPRYNEVLIITDTIGKPKRKIFPDIAKKCHHATKDECETDEHRGKSFNLVTRE